MVDQLSHTQYSIYIEDSLHTIGFWIWAYLHICWMANIDLCDFEIRDLFSSGMFGFRAMAISLYFYTGDVLIHVE